MALIAGDESEQDGTQGIPEVPVPRRVDRSARAFSGDLHCRANRMGVRGQSAAGEG